MWDVHSGFPYSIVDEQRDFVGRRNRERFPWFSSFDIQVLKKFELPFWDGKYRVRVGVRVLNLFDRFNPRDVQNNVSSPRFGEFFNSRDRSIVAKFILDF